MVIRLFVLVMLAYLGREYYNYAADQNYEWTHHPYYFGIFIVWFGMLMLLRDNRFKY